MSKNRPINGPTPRNGPEMLYRQLPHRMARLADSEFYRLMSSEMEARGLTPRREGDGPPQSARRLDRVTRRIAAHLLADCNVRSDNPDCFRVCERFIDLPLWNCLTGNSLDRLDWRRRERDEAKITETLLITKNN